MCYNKLGFLSPIPIERSISHVVDEVCEVVTLVVDEIDKPNIDASSTGKELFINGFPVGQLLY